MEIQQVHGPRTGQWAVAPDEFFQGQAVQVLHDIIKGAVRGGAVVVDLNSVRMTQGRRRLDLALEARQVVGVAGTLGPDELDRARALEQHVLGQIDLAHAARANHLFELVLT